MAERGARWKQWAGWIALCSTPVLSGCDGFFIRENGGGSGTNSTLNRAYVLNASTQNVAAFTIGSGTLGSVSGSPFALGYTPRAAVVTRANNFLYIAGPTGVYEYIIGTDGSLSAPSTGAFAASAAVVSLDVSPDGNWLFGLDATNNALDEWKINLSTGTLTALAASTYSVNSGVIVSPQMVRVSPKGDLVFAALGTGGDAVFTFNTTTGVTTVSQYLPPTSITTSDNALAVNTAGTYLYIARSGTSGGMAVYTIGTAGALNVIAGSPFAAGTQPNSVLIDNAGKYIYLANRQDGTISGYAIGTGGALTALNGSPYTSGSLVTSLAEDRTGTYVLAAATGGTPDLTMYSFDANFGGKLNSAATAATGAAPTNALGVAMTH